MAMNLMKTETSWNWMGLSLGCETKTKFETWRSRPPPEVLDGWEKEKLGVGRETKHLFSSLPNVLLPFPTGFPTWFPTWHQKSKRFKALKIGMTTLQMYIT